MSYLTAKQAADHLNLSVWEIYRLANSGELRGSKRSDKSNWRFEVEDLDAWVDEHENRPRSRKRRKRSA